MAAQNGGYEPSLPGPLLNSIGLGALELTGPALHAVGLDLALASVWEYAADYFSLPLFPNRLQAAAEILRLLPLLEEEHETLFANELAVIIIEALDTYERALAAVAAQPCAAEHDPKPAS
ncbi:MAG: hypothetical protein Q4B96_03130 [Bacillota bacterium]|nr:hypothetical protein [Bacillota bacterium]